MKCSQCGNPMTPLFISWCCDHCEQAAQQTPAASKVNLSISMAFDPCKLHTLANVYAVLERRNLRVTHVVLHPTDLSELRRAFKTVHNIDVTDWIWGAEIMPGTELGFVSVVNQTP